VVGPKVAEASAVTRERRTTIGENKPVKELKKKDPRNKGGHLLLGKIISLDKK